MPAYSEQDLKYAAEFREQIHREALAIVRKTRPDLTDVVDRHPVEEYFQETLEYPGKLYTVVAVPYGYKSRKALVDAIVKDTLSASAYGNERTCARKERRTANAEPEKKPERESDPFYTLISGYPDLAVDYFIVSDGHYCGYASHRKALKAAFERLGGEWEGDPDRAAGRPVTADEMFSPERQNGKLSYRKAFLFPPHGNGLTDRDFARVNTTLFPNGTDELEIYEWDTDWSDYFSDGREWWGTLCLTVYDGTLRRFAVITASATD